MSQLYQYKSKVPVVLKAAQAYFDKRNAVADAGFKFAQLFGKAEDTRVFFSERPNFRFLGMVWNEGKEPEQPELWSKPLKDGRRFPKKTGGGEAGRALRAKWHDNHPTDSATHKELLDIVGCEMDPFWQTPGVNLQTHVVWLQTSLPCKRHVIEVTTSQFLKVTEPTEKKEEDALN